MESRGPVDSKNVKISQAYFLKGGISFFEDFSLTNSRGALLNSNLNPLRSMQGGSLYQFYDGFWYNPTGTRTHDLLWERRPR